MMDQQDMTVAPGSGNHLTPEDAPATPQQLLSLLGELGMKTTTYEHKPVFTVEESDDVTAAIPGAHTKNLFVNDKKGRYFLIVAGNRASIPLNRVHSLIGAQGRVSFGNAEKLMELLGVTPGSVNAFAPMNDHAGAVTVIIDKPLLDHDLINCHPLINDKTTTISRDDLLRFLDHVGHPPLIVQLSETVESA